MLIKRCLISVGLAMVLIISSMLLGGTKASACSCAGTIAVEEAQAKSDAVFEGTVTAVKSSSMRLLNSPAKAVKANFQVNEVWKGHVAPTIEVLTAGSSESCGYEFKMGERYLVYATATGKSLEVNLCNGTVLHNQAEQQISLLGSGSLPPQASEGEQQSGETFVRNMILLFSVIIVGSAAALLYRKQRRTRSKT